MDELSDVTVPRIVVGVDGSEHARWALVWAMEEAASRHVALDVVCAFESHVSMMGLPVSLPAQVVHPEVMAREMKEVLEREIDWAEAKTEARPVLVRPMAIEGRPTTVLLRCGEDAELLVVGAHGRGRMAGMLLGSVSNFCSRHATVPVVVVPAPHRSQVYPRPYRVPSRAGV